MMERSIGIVTFPISKAGNIPLSNFVDVVSSFSNDIYLITGNDGYSSFVNDSRVHVYGVNHEKGTNAITRIVNFIWTQIKISHNIIKLRSNVDIYVLFIGGDGLILPMLTIKIFNKKAILAPVDYTINFGKGILSKLLKKLMNINRHLADKIVIHSPILINEWNLEKYSDKICMSHEYFIDLDEFSISKRFEHRKNLIGYVGRLSEEKGILNYIKSTRKIIEERDDIEFLICGDGPLYAEVESFLLENNLNKKVKLVGWIPHDQLHSYLNDLRLLVIPSYNESGPIVALEALACGTPILAPKVGHILNLIDDGENGFIMQTNSSECISQNILRVVDNPNMDEIIIKGRQFVETGFNYDAAVASYTKVFEDM